MRDLLEIKKEFFAAKDDIFTDKALQKDAFEFCVKFSLLVEEYIVKVVKDTECPVAICSSGSFARRELAPYSDIDVMFISNGNKESNDVIKQMVTELWDAGIEVSHTVREFNDIKRFVEEDLHAFTQFFETRFIFGDEKLYAKWNHELSQVVTDDYRVQLMEQFFDDINTRHAKYGDSPKVLEPNVKFTAGGLRDLHSVEWMYSLKYNIVVNEMVEAPTTALFLERLHKEKFINRRAVNLLRDSYKYVLDVRNKLHLSAGRKNDRLEFVHQEKIAQQFSHPGDTWREFMIEYFNAANVINRFCKTVMKGFDEQISEPLPDLLTIDLDGDFVKKGGVISLRREMELGLSDILRAFYYRGLHDGRFDENLRTQIIENIHEIEDENIKDHQSSVFFREILKLPKNVGKTLAVMNELGVLSAFLPEFRDLVGFFQPGVYHIYTADEHTITTIKNLEALEDEETHIAGIYNSLKEKDVLFLAMLLHDIAKPIDVSGHEILGAEIAQNLVPELGYSNEDSEMVEFLVKYHLHMEQVAFRRNLDDPSTLNQFASIFKSVKALNLLYLVTFADLSAVSPVVWTNWKADLLAELYTKTYEMIQDNVSGRELLDSATQSFINENDAEEDKLFIEHIESINDPGYLQHYTQEEINEHIEEIENGIHASVFYKNFDGFTNITLITRDSTSLLARLCGALTINDLNIHGAKIFTRNDGIVIDSFNVTDYRTHRIVDPGKYEKIEQSIVKAVENKLPITAEFSKTKKKWWRIESKIFRRKSKVSIVFEDHELYTIIDVFSPDRLGLLYKITSKLNELELSTYLAKISTRADDVVDSFYVLDRSGNKISESDYELIRLELSQAISEIL